MTDSQKGILACTISSVMGKVTRCYRRCLPRVNSSMRLLMPRRIAKDVCSSIANRKREHVRSYVLTVRPCFLYGQLFPCLFSSHLVMFSSQLSPQDAFSKVSLLSAYS